MVKQKLQKASTTQQTSSAPIPFLQPRAFAETNNAMTQDALQPDLQAQIDQATMFGHSLGRINARPLSHLPIQPKLTIGKVGDPYEQEADRVAAQVVQQINQPATAPGKASVQRQVPEEEELQMKPLANSIQRVETPEEDELQMKPVDTLQREVPEEDELQMKPLSGVAEGDVSSKWEGELNQARGGGQPLPPTLKEPMERSFGVDFSGVRVHTGTQANQLSQSIQAKAFTTGQDVFFRQGAYEPGSRGGQELIAHELTHVVQQGSGKKAALQKQEQLVQRYSDIQPIKDTKGLFFKYEKLKDANHQIEKYKVDCKHLQHTILNFDPESDNLTVYLHNLQFKIARVEGDLESAEKDLVKWLEVCERGDHFHEKENQKQEVNKLLSEIRKAKLDFYSQWTADLKTWKTKKGFSSVRDIIYNMTHTPGANDPMVGRRLYDILWGNLGW